ncbi:MAG: hypothetical protein QM778_07950 [Myxococcales bacterium]
MLPEPLCEPFVRAKSIVSRYVALLPQAALLDFMESGEFGRHLRRMRERYAERHQALVEALASELPSVRVAGGAAGLELSVWLPEKLQEARATELLRQAEIYVQTLGEHRLRKSAQGGLLLGFAAFSARRMRSHVGEMRRALNL